MPKLDLTRAIAIKGAGGELLALKGDGFSWVKPSTGYAWLPTSSPNLLAWYDADDASTRTLDDDGRVSQLDDKSGNGFHATQSEPFNRPSISDSSGIDTTTHRFLDLPNNIFTATSSPTAIVIGQSSARGSGLTYTSVVSSNHWPWQDGSIYEHFMSDTRPSFSGLVAPFTVARIVSLSKPTATTLSVFSNGALLGTKTANTRAPTKARFGTTYDDYNVREIVMLNSDTDRQKVEGYLAHKWGLAAQLPAGHPYKSAAP